ncbi:MAG: hypothetical protein QM597_07755 [Aeromicrobium sp.]|uniref:hypothetical protein n=1 Tax=Aeromicrobium sp. TaxID=1871063 RepID=UPI0039E4917D
MKTYKVTVTREDGYWVAVVDGLRGGATEARTLAKLDVEVRDLIVGLTDTTEDDFTVDYALPTDIENAVREWEASAAAAASARAAYEATQTKVARHLAGQHVSVRDAARLVGVSHQRVAQLLAG